MILNHYELVATLNRWIGDMELNKLTPEHLQTLFFTLKEKGIDGHHKGYSKNSLQTLRQTLNMILKYCVNKSLLSGNPLEGIK